MGLLSFKKRSKKQQISNHSPAQSDVNVSRPLTFLQGQDYLSLSSATLAKHQELSKAKETSLMDDIMNELGSPKAQTPLCGRPAATSVQTRTEAALSNPATSAELQFANSSKMQQKSPLHESKKPALRSPPLTTNQERKEQQQQRYSINVAYSNANEDSAVSGSKLPTTSTFNRYSAPVTMRKPSATSSPPEPPFDSDHPIVEDLSDSSRDIMNRLKERHRQEARKSSSPFGSRAVSSPSMPIINGAVDLSNKNRPLKRITQSQSFMSYVRPSNNNENNSIDSSSATNNLDRQSNPIQTKPDMNVHNIHQLYYLPQTNQIMHKQSPSIPENKDREAAPMFLKQKMSRSISAYAGLSTQSIHQQQQILLQQQLLQQQIQQQIGLKQQHLEEQQQLQQQRLQQIQHQQKKQHEQDSINRAILDSLMMSSLETHNDNEAVKHHLMLKPLYKRSSEGASRNKRGHHHHHHHHHRRQCSCNSNHHVHQSIVLPKNLKACRSSPEAIDETKEEPTEASPISPAGEHNDIDALVNNSSSSTLGAEVKPSEDKKLNIIRLPRKLKHELQDMHLRRSLYSVPDLSKFSQEYISETEETDSRWDTISLFHSMLDKSELSAPKLKVSCDGRKRCSKKLRPAFHSSCKCCQCHRQRHYHCHNRHCCSVAVHNNCSHDQWPEKEAADYLSSTKKLSVEIDCRTSICRSKKHCRHT